MRTIEEIAKLLCLCANAGEKCKTCEAKEDGCECSDYRTYQAAKEAILLSQKWIPVEEELPENSDNERGYLVRNTYGYISVAVSYRNNIFWSRSYVKYENITHWRLIELH